MGNNLIMCYIGFPTHRPSNLAERLECHSAELATAFHSSHRSLFDAMAILHDAVDHAVEGCGGAARECLNHGLEGLADADRHVTTTCDLLVRTRRELESHLDDTRDPFVRRERQFRRLDRGRLLAELAHYGVDGRRDAEFQQMLSAVLDGGTPAGIRVLEKEARRMQTRLREYASATEGIPLDPLHDFATASHRRAAESQALCLPWSRFPTLCGYLGLLCEAALEEELALENVTLEQTA